MLLNLNELWSKYNMEVRGVIQVGAHWGQELEEYKSRRIKNMMFIEPSKAAFDKLVGKISPQGTAELVERFMKDTGFIPTDEDKRMYHLWSESCIHCYNYACGDGTEGDTVEAHTEHTNQGQSNSILAPKVHLQQHGDVIFDSRETWSVRTLDSLLVQGDSMVKGLSVYDYNFLNMDCQGYEGRVVKGASETLKHIDYIYSEVNRLEMYEGNTMINELMDLLPDFKMVEVGWASDYHGWGDAFFIRKTLL